MSQNIRALARADIRAATLYYKVEAGRDIASRFLTAVEDAIAFLDRNPQAGSTRQGTTAGLPRLRSWPVKGFPYLLFYREEGDRILILRVLHAAREVPPGLRE